MLCATRAAMTTVPPRCAPSLGRQRGISLLELMIAAAVGAVIIVGALNLFVASQQNFRVQAQHQQMQENGRRALQLIAAEVRMANYYGLNVFPAQLDTRAVASIQFSCGRAGWATRVTEPIFAANNVNPYRDTCIPAANYRDGTDVLVVRHVARAPSAYTKIKSGRFYLYTALATGAVFRAEQDGAINTAARTQIAETPAAVYEFLTSAYYIRPCSDPGGNRRCDDRDDATPTLVRKVLASQYATTEALVENIENLQFSFGIDNNADGGVDQYVTAEAVSDWRRVLAVRIAVLVRAAEAITGYTNTNSYVFADQQIVADDHYYRELFSVTQALPYVLAP